MATAAIQRRRLRDNQTPDATNIAASAINALTLPRRGNKTNPASSDPAIAPATFSEYNAPMRLATSSG